MKKRMKSEEIIREQKLEIEELKQEKKDRIRYVLYIIMFLILLFVSTFGITVSFYKGGSKEPQQIETDPIPDKIIFTYSDVDGGGSGINIINAAPTSDSKGKIMIGKGEYFDFSITTTSNNTDLLYKILIKKDKQSTLDNSNVKVYLTAVSGSYEKGVVLTTIDRLPQETIDGTNYYVLYSKELGKGIENYSDFYRLRMWVKEDATNFEDKKFMLKVDVTASGVGE